MRVLLATDGSIASQDADWLLARIPFAEPIDLLIAHVAVVPSLAHLRREFPSSVSAIVEEYRSNAAEILKQEAERFDGINGTVETALLDGHAADEIVHLAEEMHRDLIVMGARGQSATQRFFLGSVSLQVASHAPCSVLVTRPSPQLKAEGHRLKLLVCDDGSESSQQAVQMLSEIHWGENVEISIVGVIPTNIGYGTVLGEQLQAIQDSHRQQLEVQLAQTVSLLQKVTPHVSSRVVEQDSVSAAILEVAEESSADLVVMGHRGMSQIKRFFLGSVSETVLRHAGCSVWIVREK